MPSGSFIRGVGIDTSNVVRFDRLCGRYGDRFTRRWFTHAEIAQCSAAAQSGAEYASRFAAKESVWKAMRIPAWAGPVPWLMISVLRTPGLLPAVCIKLTGEVRRAALELGVTRIHVNFTKSGSIAVAAAVVECDQPPNSAVSREVAVDQVLTDLDE